MKLFTLILLVFSCFSTVAQIYRGVNGLDEFHEELSQIDNSLRSNPSRYYVLRENLLAHTQKEEPNMKLSIVLDIFHGSHFYFQNDLDSASFYFNSAIEKSTEINHDQLYRTAKIRKIFCEEYTATKSQMANEMKLVYIDSYNKKDTLNMLYSLNGMGIFYRDLDSVSLALKIYYEALRLAEMSQNKNELAFIHNNLGLIKYDLGALDSAFSDFSICLALGEEQDDKALQSIAKQNMGLYYGRIDSVEKARSQYHEVIQLGKEFNYPLYIVSASTNLAALEMQEGNAELSHALSEQALTTSKESKLYYAIPNIYLGKAYYELKSENFPLAHQMLDSAKAYSEYSSYTEIMPPLLHLRYRVYEESGDFENALETYKLKTEVNDSIAELGNAKLLSELQFKYDDEKKERLRSIEKNKLKLELKQQEVDMTKFRQNVVVGLSIAVFIVLFLIVMYFRLKQKSDNLFSFTIANKLEEERSRIARDLHDGLGQSLIILKNKFNNIEIPNAKAAEQVNENFSEVIEEVRSISRTLIPPELKRLGLKMAIENMCTDIENSTGLIVTTELDALEKVGFEDHHAIRVYRIIQEMCTNTIKHSRASSLKIESQQEGNNLIVIYQDNGSGLDIQQWKSANNSVGFKSIEQRLKYLNASAKLEKPKEGFKLVIKIPIK